MAPMAAEGNEAVGSMGNDAALAVLSRRPQLLYNYFRQLFAQVTNPPVDGIREDIIMTMDTTIGGEGNLLAPTAVSCRQIKLKSPILKNEELEKLRQLDGTYRKGGSRPLMAGRFKSITLPMLFRVAGGVDELPGRWRNCAARPAKPLPAATILSSFRTAGSIATMPPFPHFWRRPACTIT